MPSATHPLSGPERFEAMKEACAKREHGTRARYVGGCRCMRCRAANSRYEVERAAQRAEGDWNGVVSAAAARRRLRTLERKGIGYKQAADAAGVNAGIVFRIRSGKRKRIRARTERKILEVTADAMADGVDVDAEPVHQMIEILIDEGGFTKAEIARRMGYKGEALQVKSRVKRSTFHKFRRFFEQYFPGRKVPKEHFQANGGSFRPCNTNKTK